jgi:prohibitin 2
MAFFVLAAIFAVAFAVAFVYGRAEQTLGRESGNADRVRRGRLITQGGSVLFAILVIGLVLIRAIHFVDAGHVGIVKQFGDIVGREDSGAVWIAPWRSIDEVSVQIQSETFVMDSRRQAGTGSAVSRDSQAIYATVTLNYQLDPANIEQLYRETGGHYRERLIAPRVPQVFKSVTARYRAINFAANRERIRRQTQQLLDGQLEQDSIHVTDFLIEDIGFTDEFARAIEETQVARQRAEREKARVEIARQRAQQAIERARGDAESNLIRTRAQADANRLLAASLSAKVIQFKAIEKLNPQLRTAILPSGSNFLLPSTILEDGAQKGK